MTPSLRISAICLTFGRVALLEEALESFLRQGYANKELVIFNTCARQTLVFDHPQVKIINSKVRPKTLGETRNMAVAEATGDLMVTWDSDDVMTPLHLWNFLKSGFNPERHDWVRHSHQLYLEGRRLKGIVPGTANTFAFTKRAWMGVGKYNAQNTGEDSNFLGRVASMFDGLTVQLAPQEASYGVSWNDETFHVSGEGEDKPGQPTGTEAVGAWTELRMGALFEPTGVIELKPHWKHDYVTMLKTFNGGVTNLLKQRRGKIGCVLLGHAGDIFNCLPMAKFIHDRTGVRPMWFVSRPFAPVLECVSYVEPVPLDIAELDVLDAIKFAQQRCEITLMPQVYGNNYPASHDTKCFNTEEWRMCGLLDRFEELPLVIDRRNAVREFVLVQSVKDEKPMILANLTGGVTAPWKDGQKVLDYLKGKWGQKFNVVDMAAIRAERIYDMLGLMDAAALLVSNDTYALHLAAASKVPVVAILNDGHYCWDHPWLKTACRCNTVLELEYLTAAQRLSEIDKVIEGL